MYPSNCRVEKVQVKAARIITGLRVNSTRSCLYDELGWESLHLRRTIHKLNLMYKIINGVAPDYLNEVIHPFFPVHHSHNLRSGSKNLHMYVYQLVKLCHIILAFFHSAY